MYGCVECWTCVMSSADRSRDRSADDMPASDDRFRRRFQPLDDLAYFPASAFACLPTFLI